VGTVGNATLGLFSPGHESPWKTFGYDIASGTIHTKSLLLTGTSRFDLAPGGASDQVQVAGTVSVGGSLIVDLLSGAPAAGQTFTLIDNDGADPVTGTFNGMPEGVTFAVGTSTFAISYHGGDGNDVVLTTLSSQKSWTGAVSSFWSDSHNWSPQAVPSSGEVLLFPAGAVRLTMTNDLPAGTIAGAMTFNDNYTLSGNALTLNGDLAFHRDANNYANVQVTFNTDLKLVTAVTFGSAPNNYNGAIDVNGQTLTIDENNTINDTARLNGPLIGSGTVMISGPGVYVGGTGTFSGTINGAMNVSGSLPNAAVNGRLTGVGTVGNAVLGTFSPGNESPWKTFGFDDAAGVIHTKSLVLNGGARFDLAPGATSDQVQVTGSVAVAGPLTLNILSGALTVGQSFILIDNDGADPVSGTFTGMPEHASFVLGGQMARISYHGGDGNDVVLSVPAPTTTVLTQNAADTKVGESWTLTATVTSPGGFPTGVVSFSADGVTLGTAAVVNGVAALTIAPATAGTRQVTATFIGTDAFIDSASAVLSHVVSPGQTKTDLAGDYPSGIFGQTVQFTATVSVIAPAAGQPGGNVTFQAEGIAIGTAPVVNGVATLAVSNLSVGSHSITATFPGNGNFLNSVSAAITYEAIRAETKTVLAADHASSVYGQAVHFTATVSVVAPGTGQPDGNVTFQADGAAIGTAPVLNGLATLAVANLSVGSHSITATFPGNGNFFSSVSAAITCEAARGETKTELATDHQSSAYGQVVRFTATVSAVAPAAGTPGGNVTILADGNVLGTVPIVNGTAFVETASLHAGSRSISATYIGDANFTGSTASALQQPITKAVTRVDATVHGVVIGAASSVNVSVSVPARSNLIPSGTVTIKDAGGILGSSPLAQGLVNLDLAPLPAGDHTLTVTFSGDADFEASSATVIQTVMLPAISAGVAHIVEGGRGGSTATIAVTLSAPVLVNVRVSFSTVPGSAKEAEDYEKASGVVEFAPGQVTRAIELHIIGDTIPEGTETFSLVLFDPVNSTIDSLSIPIVIVDDDQVPSRHRASRP